MSPDDKTFWFPVRTDGRGVRWQGLAVILGFLALLIGGHYIVKPSHPSLYFVCIDTLSVLFILILWMKSEKPFWRWGKKNS